MVLRSFWRQNQLHGTHSFQENTILVNQFGWYKILMANFQCVLSHYCTSFHETIYKGINTCVEQIPLKPPKLCLLLQIRLLKQTFVVTLENIDLFFIAFPHPLLCWWDIQMISRDSQCMDNTEIIWLDKNWCTFDYPLLSVFEHLGLFPTKSCCVNCKI